MPTNSCELQAARLLANGLWLSFSHLSRADRILAADIALSMDKELRPRAYQDIAGGIARGLVVAVLNELQHELGYSVDQPAEYYLERRRKAPVKVKRSRRKDSSSGAPNDPRRAFPSVAASRDNVPDPGPASVDQVQS